MSYELVWQPEKGTWAVFSTVTCSYAATGLRSPEQVADFIVTGDYYFIEVEGQRVAVRCEWTSREQLIRYWEGIINSPPIRASVWNGSKWVDEKVNPAEIMEHRRLGYGRALADWDSGKSRPDPAAKKQLREYWIREANDVRAEAKTGIPLYSCDVEKPELTGKVKYERPPPDDQV